MLNHGYRDPVKSYQDFGLYEGLAPLPTTLFKGQLTYSPMFPTVYVYILFSTFMSLNLSGFYFVLKRGKKKKKRSSRCGSPETNPSRKHEVVGSTPGLTQWVKDPALP